LQNLFNNGVWSPKFPFIVAPAIVAIISILLNISLIFVSFKKLKVNKKYLNNYQIIKDILVEYHKYLGNLSRSN